MNNVLLLNSLTQLANAIGVLGYYLEERDDKYAVAGHLQMFEKQIAQLRSELQPNSDVQPQLNKPDVSSRREQLIAFADWVFEQPKHLGGQERELVDQYLNEGN